MSRFPSFLFLLIATFVITALSPASAALCHPDDKKGLLAIKQFWNNPYGLASWVPSTGCCGWKGVHCDPVTGRVDDLTISDDANITGTMPSALGDLQYLVTLDIRNLPHLTGSIPSALTRLRKLVFLRLDSNDLTGPVPAFLAQLPELWYLNLGFNRLTGSIPAALGGLTKLKYLALDHNLLTGPVPTELGRLPTGSRLLLSHNDLYGPLPRSFGAVNFSVIDLSRNRLFGDATLLFGKKKVYLTSVDLSFNAFEFDLGRVEFPTVTEEEFHTIKLNNNKIYGRIPKEISGLLDLVTLDFSYNLLCGEIPTAGIMYRFKAEAYAHNRCLCGEPLPPCK